MSWKERLYRSLPYALVILAAAGVAITDELWLAIVGLVGMWLLPSPIPSSDRSGAWPNVSRETLEGPKDESVDEFRTRIKNAAGISAPCVVMHGSAEPHVLGCEGWTFGPD